MITIKTQVSPEEKEFFLQALKMPFTTAENLSLCGELDPKVQKYFTYNTFWFDYIRYHYPEYQDPNRIKLSLNNNWRDEFVRYRTLKNIKQSLANMKDKLPVLDVRIEFMKNLTEDKLAYYCEFSKDPLCEDNSQFWLLMYRENISKILPTLNDLKINSENFLISPLAKLEVTHLVSSHGLVFTKGLPVKIPNPPPISLVESVSYKTLYQHYTHERNSIIAGSGSRYPDLHKLIILEAKFGNSDKFYELFERLKSDFSHYPDLDGYDGTDSDGSEDGGWDAETKWELFNVLCDCLYSAIDNMHFEISDFLLNFMGKRAEHCEKEIKYENANISSYKYIMTKRLYPFTEIDLDIKWDLHNYMKNFIVEIAEKTTPRFFTQVLERIIIPYASSQNYTESVISGMIKIILKELLYNVKSLALDKLEILITKLDGLLPFIFFDIKGPDEHSNYIGYMNPEELREFSDRVAKVYHHLLDLSIKYNKRFDVHLIGPKMRNYEREKYKYGPKEAIILDRIFGILKDYMDPKMSSRPEL